jgi:hypothetical protein
VKVKKFWHDVYIPRREEGRQTFFCFLEKIKQFHEIPDIDHQVYFINTLKWPFWSIGEEYFEAWSQFILHYIQHPSGKIRQAILHAADYLILDLAFDLRSDTISDIHSSGRESVERNKDRFCNFVDAVGTLIERYCEPRFYRFTYVSSMPPSIYKSLQKLMTEVLLRSEYYQDIYNKHVRLQTPEQGIISRS